MSSLNRVVLVGRMTADAELKYSPNGNAVASFTVAVNRTYTNQSGEREADFPRVVCFKKLAENTANYTKKGSLVGVDGRLQTRTYEGQNGKVYVTEIVADSVQFLEPKGQSSNNQQSQNNNQSNNDPYDMSSQELPF
jgi:single-strand DNA-binding protein